MTAYDAEMLSRQLAALGRDLSDEVARMGELEEESVDREGEFRRLESAYDDAYDRAFLDAEGAQEIRKATARLECIKERDLKLEANLAWNRAKGRVHTQSANLQAIHRRIEVGRSLLSREKALLSLSGIGEV